MKTIPAILCAAAIASVFYLGHVIETSANLTSEKIDRLVAESIRWNKEPSEIYKRWDRLPATAKTTTEQVVKGGTRQFEKELVGAPTEIAKTVVKNTANTGEKAYKDTVKEATRFIRRVF
jgi:hypothetical protein